MCCDHCEPVSGEHVSATVWPELVNNPDQEAWLSASLLRPEASSGVEQLMA